MLMRHQKMTVACTCLCQRLIQSVQSFIQGLVSGLRIFLQMRCDVIAHPAAAM